MVKKVLQQTVVASACGVVFLSLVGCGALESKKVDYRSTKRTQPLDIPPELSAPSKDERYTVSELGSKGTSFSAYQAERSANKTEKGEPALALLPSYQKLRIERAGMQRWLVAATSPDKLWPLLRQFLAERNLTIKLESPERGLIETEWSEKHFDIPQGIIRDALTRGLGTLYSSAERDRFRIRLEPGLEKDTTEIFITHRGVEEVYITEGKDQTRWQPRASDPDLELDMLRRLMTFLGVDELKANTQLAELKLAPGRAKLLKSDKEASFQIEMDERFDRAWRRVGLVLDRNGFTVDDRDRAQGIYFVRFDDPLAEKKKEEAGIFSFLAFWRDNKDEPKAEDRFRVLIVGTGETTQVRVLNKDGTESKAKDTVQRIIDLLLKELR